MTQPQLTEKLGTDGNLDGCTSVEDGLTADKTLSTIHGNSTDSVLSEMLGNLENETGVTVLDLKSVQNVGQLCIPSSYCYFDIAVRRTSIELHIHDGSDDRNDLTLGGLLGIDSQGAG